MEEILDLDILSPKVKKVKINNEIIEVYPLRVNDLINIQSIDQNNIRSVVDTLKGIIPEIEKANPTIEQLTKLIQFLIQSENEPSDKKKEVTSE